MQRIVIERTELFSVEVDNALQTERLLRERQIPEAPPLSAARRLLMSSSFYLPLAGLVACVVVWLLLEPYFKDQSIIGGPVTLVNTDPFVIEIPDAVSLTVGGKEVIVVPGETRLEEGAAGQPPFAGLSEVAEGTQLEVSGVGLGDHRLLAMGLRPATEADARAAGQEIEPEITWVQVIFFPATAAAVALFLLVAEGISSRNWVRMAQRATIGVLLTVVLALLAYIPAGLVLTIGQLVLDADARIVILADDMGFAQFVVWAACRSIAWAMMGTALGLGMNLVRSTPTQRRNSVIGGAVGGALGGLFFDPVDRFLTVNSAFAEASVSRLVGLAAVGICIGIFVALVDRLAREAWIRVRTGPLAGKSFALYRSPTVVGSAPQSDIYLFKDAAIEPSHCEIHRVGNAYELEDLGTAAGTLVGGQSVRHRRLSSGDQIVVGTTVLEFEERAQPTQDGGQP